MAENFIKTGLAALFILCRSDANAVKFTVKEFEVYLNFASLTRQALK
jgi:hypothetical protein